MDGKWNTDIQEIEITDDIDKPNTSFDKFENHLIAISKQMEEELKQYVRLFFGE